ncbi:ACAD11 [Symbiodinium necroappetens]|uniref:ACAD11 protein n=1 Tax=Symbiodinium necroappetens TaxID=1628268 RepID=A0A813B9F3_9DINO|nr:ACAD11 [Symbiodinium necroappetens]
MKEHAEFGNLLSNAKQRLYNMFGQQDMKTYLERKANEWRILGDLVDGAGEGCYCEEHGVIMISPHGHFSCIFRWDAVTYRFHLQ